MTSSVPPLSKFGFLVAVTSGELIFDLVSYAWAGLGASFGPALLLMLKWKKTHWKGVLAGMITGSVVTIVWSEIEFLDEQLGKFYKERSIEYTAQIDPSDFVRWVFPHLFKARLPRYESIASNYGYTISARDAFEVSNADEFLSLIGDALN